MAEKNIGSLEEIALKRKERLQALKQKKTTSNENGKSDESGGALPKPKFRSYIPQDEQLQEHVIPLAKPGDVESEIKDQLEAAKAPVVIDELDITNLVPRKPDWDLKRDVAKKLEKLERRTQKAIAELIRERMKAEQEKITDS